MTDDNDRRFTDREEWLDEEEPMVGGRPLYYHIDGRPAKTRREGLDLFRNKWDPESPDYGMIGRSSRRNVSVSTVFLVLDHGFSLDPDAKPVLFETMVFGGRYANEDVRYHTKEEAQRGHEKISRIVLGWRRFLPKRNLWDAVER